MIRRCIATAVLAGAVSLTATAQGLYWESVSKGGPAGDSARATATYMMPKKMKVEMGDGGEVIVRLDKERAYICDGKDKSYFEMTFAEMEDMMKRANTRMDGVKEQMKEQLKTLPPEQRAAFEKQYGHLLVDSKAKSPLVMKSTGEKKTILGYPSVKHVGTQDGKEVVSMYTTKSIREFDALRKDWEQFNKRLMASNPAMAGEISDLFSKIDGFPLEMTMMGVTTTVTKVEKRALKESDFVVPAGYTKKEKPAMGLD